MVISEFLDKYYQKLEEKNLNKGVVIPKSMIIENSQDAEGWIKWQPVQTDIENDEVLTIEKQYNISIPKPYRDFVAYHRFLDIQIAEYTLFGVNELSTFTKQLEMFPKSVLSFGFLPIGQINDEDYIALNVNNGEIVTLNYDDYSFVKVLSDNFNHLVDDLGNKLK